MTVKGILFDKDGVLVDFDKTFGPATTGVLDELCGDDQKLKSKIADALSFDLVSGEFSPDSFLIAGTAEDMATHIGALLGRVDLASLANEINEIYGGLCEELAVPIEGIDTALQRLNAGGFHLGIATNDAEANAKGQMKKLGLHEQFKLIMGSDSGHGAKPSPGMIHAFMASLSLGKDQVAMIGDSTHDMEAGRAAGVMTIAVETGPASREELLPFADVVLPSIAALPDFFAS